MKLFAPFTVPIKLMVLLGFAATVTATAGRSDVKPSSPQMDGPPKGKIHLITSLVWEGRSLHDHNLETLEKFRESHPGLKFMHFVSPAYFLRDEKHSDILSKMHRVIRSGDSVGMLVAGWKTLVQESGVIFRAGPTFWGNTLDASDCETDCGSDVPVHVYPEKDLEDIIRTGKSTLSKAGLGKIESIMASGWMGSPALLAAAARQGFRYDASAVPKEIVRHRLARFPLYLWISDLWTSITPLSQPYIVTTTSPGIIEIPQNLGPVDYMTPEDALQMFRQILRGAGGKGHVKNVHLVLLQETALKYVPRTSMLLMSFREIAADENMSLRSYVAPSQYPGRKSNTDEKFRVH